MWKLVCEVFPVEVFCVVGLLLFVKNLVKEVQSWRAHWIVADLVSEWQRAALKSKMKKVGIKFRPCPWPDELAVLPCNLMVLSAVMMSMWSVAMARPVPVVPPVPWVEIVKNMRVSGTHPVKAEPRKPPDPPPQAASPSVDGEGEKVASGERVVNQLSEEEAAHLAGFDVLTGVPFCMTCDQWADVGNHVGKAPLKGLLHQVVRSFGALGLLASSKDPSCVGTAIVDTGASLTVTPHREDFVSHQEVKGQVLKGLSSGAQVEGVGTVHWKLEVGNKLVDLHLRALHVPETEDRLLCPQQLIQEHKPELPPGRIEKTCVRLEFPEREYWSVPTMQATCLW
jgi:hypothetical protein